MNSLHKSTRGLSGLLVVLVSLLLAACDVPGKVQRELTEEQHAALVERVSQYWQALEGKDYARAYEYTTPNYRRVFPKNMFLNKFGYSLQWELTGVEVTHYDGDAAVASVVVRVMSSPTKPTSEASQILGAVPISRKEKWLLREGQWWKSPKI